MSTIKGPGIFLAQVLGDEAPYNNLKDICKQVAALGYKSIQLPTWDTRIIDIQKAALHKDYCQEIQGIVAEAGLEISELSTHLQGQLVAVHNAYSDMFDGFAPKHVQGNNAARTVWATEQIKYAATASKHMGIKPMATFSGSLMFHTVYPWPQRPKGLVKEGFKELAKRWLPILNHCQDNGVELCYEIHPGEDLHDGITFERFLEATRNHKSVKILYDPSHFVLQQLDYLQYIDFYHEYIKMFHVKDAEFNATGKSGVYGGYQDWIDRPGRFRSLGDGQVDFKTIFSKLTQYGYDGWAVLEWECCIKSLEQGIKEGAPFIYKQLIETTTKSFDDFAATNVDKEHLHKILGI